MGINLRKKGWGLAWPKLLTAARLCNVSKVHLDFRHEQIIFIGPESDHWLCLSVTLSLTHSLTDSLLFSKLDGLVWSQLLDDVVSSCSVGNFLFRSIPPIRTTCTTFLNANVFGLAIWLWQDELNPRVRCAFGNVFEHYSSISIYI